MSKTKFFKSMLKDGYILKNRAGVEFIVMPSIDRDFLLNSDGEEMGHIGTGGTFDFDSQ